MFETFWSFLGRIGSIYCVKTDFFCIFVKKTNLFSVYKKFPRKPVPQKIWTLGRCNNTHPFLLCQKWFVRRTPKLLLSSWHLITANYPKQKDFTHLSFSLQVFPPPPCQDRSFIVLKINANLWYFSIIVRYPLDASCYTLPTCTK